MKKLYKTLDTIPIWNFDKILTNNDIRYLLKLKDYEKLPKIGPFTQIKLLKAYTELMNAYQKGTNKILISKRRCLRAISNLVIEISRTSKNPEKIKKASLLLRGLMIDLSKDEFIKDVDWLETPEQKMLLTHIKIELRKYQTQKEKLNNLKTYTIYEQVARLESVLGIKINMYTCNVEQYQAYIQEANNKQQQQ